MGMPWTLDALKAAPERYASQRFRRFAGVFDPYRAQFAEAVELAALNGVVDDVHLRYVFHWSWATLRDKVRPLLAHGPVQQAAQALIAENRALVTADDGRALLAAMQDGGWKGGKPPALVRMAVFDLRKQGLSWPAVAEVLRISVDQARNIGNGAERPCARASRLLAKGGDEAVGVAGTSWLVA